MPEPKAHLDVSETDGVTVARFTERKMLDEMAIAEIGQELSSLIADRRSPKLVLDFSGVSHMSSSALGMLITLHKRMKDKDGQLRLACIESKIYEVFVITRLNEIFEIHSTVDSAVESLR